MERNAELLFAVSIYLVLVSILFKIPKENLGLSVLFLTMSAATLLAGINVEKRFVEINWRDL
ncbi:hypothetical protein Huta_1303 [Halorhabdus utahensis DSM 12940]|uniref:Uncharacterized protein n=1 Tax=Halorhabdus utahensis (strain DSM 12940 / JCM 11049 / AX-2) TaxID=519442 RepID=C7NN79_HALUD|nr:hypothetical protein [Halorhabdus utahensis]ACV11479.1 hypothetical protein Huta_1303 [Halorhabdus utahensis DSM 12940]